MRGGFKLVLRLKDHVRGGFKGLGLAERGETLALAVAGRKTGQGCAPKELQETVPRGRHPGHLGFLDLTLAFQVFSKD